MSKDADLTEVECGTVVTKATVVDEEVNEGMLVKRYILSERISQETLTSIVASVTADILYPLKKSGGC